MISGLGGHVLQFRPLAQALLPDWDITGVLYPIYAGGMNTCESIPDLAHQMHQALEDTDGPIVLIGYSLGGAIAYQIAVELHAKGKDVAVVCIDTAVRSLRRKRGRFARGVRNLFYRTPRNVLASWRRSNRPMPQQSSDQVWQPREDKLKVFVEESRIAMRGYVPPKSDAPVVLIRAEAHRDWRNWIDGPFWPSTTHGWAKVAPVAGVVSGPGDHLTIISQGNVDALAIAVDQALRIAFERIPSARQGADRG